MNDIDIDEMLLELGTSAIDKLKSIYNSFSSMISSVSLTSGELSTAHLLDESKELINKNTFSLENLSSRLSKIKSLFSSEFANIDSIFNFINNDQETEQNQNVKEMPLYDQTDYANVKYSTGTIASSGCGITCLAMVASYLTGEVWTPDECAALGNVVEGHKSDNVGRMLTAADKIGLSYEQKTTSDIIPSLQEGKVVIALVNNSGHFVVLKGLTDDGKVLVNDPYGPWQDTKDQTGQNLTFSEWGAIQQNDINLTAGRIWVFDGTTSDKFNFTTEEEQTITV